MLFRSPHKNGQPLVNQLLKKIYGWHKELAKKKKVHQNRIAVLIPGDQWPIAVVIETIEELRSSDLFDDVVLAGGLFKT